MQKHTLVQLLFCRVTHCTGQELTRTLWSLWNSVHITGCSPIVTLRMQPLKFSLFSIVPATAVSNSKNYVWSGYFWNQDFNKIFKNLPAIPPMYKGLFVRASVMWPLSGNQYILLLPSIYNVISSLIRDNFTRCQLLSHK